MDNLNALSSYTTPDLAAFRQKSDVQANSEQVTSIPINDGFKPSDPLPSEPPKMFGNAVTSSLNQVFFNYEGMDKDKYQFGLQSFAQGNDGTLYIGYSDPDSDEGNYIAAHSPDGKVKWEAHVGSDGLENMKMTPDGSLMVQSKNYLRTFNPDGTEKSRSALPCSVKDNNHWVDSKGNNYFRNRANGEFAVVDNQGVAQKTPLKLRGFDPGDNVKVDAGDVLWVLKDNALYQADFANGNLTKKTEIHEKEKLARKENAVTDFSPTKDGGAFLVLRQPDDIPPMFSRPDDYEATFLCKTDASGNVQWRSGKRDADLKVVFSSDDRMFSYEDPRQVRYHKQQISVTGPDGSTDKFCSIDGDIRKMLIDPATNNLYVQYKHSGQENYFVAVISPDAKQIHNEKMIGPTYGTELYGFDKNGNVLVADDDGNTLKLWDIEHDNVVTLTDHKRDYTFKTQAPESSPEKQNDDGSPGIIEQMEGAVNVDGVNLNKRKPKKIEMQVPLPNFIIRQ